MTFVPPYARGILLAIAACVLCTGPGCASVLRPRERIALDVLEPAERAGIIEQFPVSVGLVFPKGEIVSPPGGRLVDDRGVPIPFEVDVTGWWRPAAGADEKPSAKWLLLHFRATTNRRYFFEPGKQPSRPPGNPIVIAGEGDVTVNTGPLRARLSRSKPSLFEEVQLNGKPMLAPAMPAHTLVADDGKTQTPGDLKEWALTVEENTMARASIEASGMYRYPDGKPMARIELRYQFFAGESFVRVYHTLTWMVQDTKVGIREISMGFRPAIGDGGRAQVGLSDFTPDAHEKIWNPETSLKAWQDTGEHFQIDIDGKKAREGKQLGGWFALHGEGSRSIAVSLRHAWQTYPTELSFEKGRLDIRFWPARAPRMSFAPEAIMGERIFRHPSWKRFAFAKKEGHFVNNYKDTKGFMYTAEGAAWTHELLISFHDARTDRTAAELNTVTQHPVVVRQDPAAAMRVPFLAFDIMPVDHRKYPNVERAVDMLGQFAMGRWVKENNYGLLRFGMVRWHRHSDYDFYRWMDNTQYDQQLIPWLLYMRGGGRRWHEDGEIVSRYCMDMNVNHYNTRNSPTGYMATCGGALPFPNFAFSRWNMKGMKLHFLAYYWHLTGYRRAKDVMDKVIEGTKAFARAEAKERGKHTLVGGREMYNMNRFWSVAYEETGDPEIAEFARNSRHVTATREYNRKTMRFGGPVVYLYEGLLMQDKLFQDPALREVMQHHLAGTMLPVEDGGGIRSVNDTIACPWAYARTGDPRFAGIAWDTARGLVDLVPSVDFGGEGPPFYPYTYNGNNLLHHHLWPILTGVALGDRLGLDPKAPSSFRDLFVFLAAKKRKPPWRSEVFVRSLAAGPISLRILAQSHGKGLIKVSASGPDGGGPNDFAMQPQEPPAFPRFRKDIVLPAMKPGDTFKLVIESDTPASVAVLGSAQIVHHVPLDLWHSNEPLCGGQGYTPQKIFTRAVEDVVSYSNRAQRPFTMRDAETGELLFRPTTFKPGEGAVKVGKDRMLEFTVRGCRSHSEWQLTGVAPYISATREGWFDPAAPAAKAKETP